MNCVTCAHLIFHSNEMMLWWLNSAMLLQIINKSVSKYLQFRYLSTTNKRGINIGFYALWKTISQFIWQLFNEYLEFAQRIDKQIDLKQETLLGNLCIYLSIISLEYDYTAYEHKFVENFGIEWIKNKFWMLIDHEGAILSGV